MSQRRLNDLTCVHFSENARTVTSIEPLLHCTLKAFRIFPRIHLIPRLRMLFKPNATIFLKRSKFVHRQRIAKAECHKDSNTRLLPMRQISAPDFNQSKTGKKSGRRQHAVWDRPRPLCDYSRGVGLSQADRPRVPRGIGLSQADRPRVPGGVGLSQADRPRVPRGVGLSQADIARPSSSLLLHRLAIGLQPEARSKAPADSDRDSRCQKAPNKTQSTMTNTINKNRSHNFLQLTSLTTPPHLGHVLSCAGSISPQNSHFVIIGISRRPSLSR